MTMALILAGKRDGALDPLALAAGVGHKCVVPVAGRPMIAHVIDALLAAPVIERILISIDDVHALDGITEVEQGIALGRIQIVGAERNLVDSIFSALRGARFPVFVTTADNVLLDPASILAIDEQGRRSNADIAVAFATRSAVLAAYPEGQRRFYRFSDDAYSNCNSYWIGGRKALAAAEVFRDGGQFAKYPMRIVRAFGFLNLVRFRFGIGTMDAAFRRFSRRFGLRIRPVILANGAVAIDVDNERTHRIAEELLHVSPLRDLAVAAE